MIKKVLLLAVLVIGICPFALFTSNGFAEEIPEDIATQKAPPVDFENIENIDQILNQIDNFYLRYDDPLFKAAPGTKWQAGEKVWDGHVGYYVTSYFWVRGSDMVSWNIVGNAQRKAVISKYGSVNNSTSYKMKTTQHITLKGKWSYKTISASAWCYGR